MSNPDFEQFAPDFGLRTLADGHPRDVELNYYPFKMPSIGLVGPGRYTTSVGIEVQGVSHLLTLDFDSDTLATILEVCPKVRSEIEQWVSGGPVVGKTFRLSEPAYFGLTAAFGELQQGAYEPFVPLVARHVIRVR